MTPDSTRRTHRLAAVACAAAVALGTAGCGQPFDLQVQSAPSQPEASHTSEVTSDHEVTPGEQAPTPLTTPSDEAATSREPAPRDAPRFGDRRAEEPTDEPVRDESAAEEPASDEPPVLEVGDSGEAVEALQQRLADLGYWVGSTDGTYGDLTEQAVLAFQGWEGLTRDGRVGPATRMALEAASRPAPEADGDLIEVHLDQQVLLVVEDGRTLEVLHVSTGSGERYTHPSGHENVADTPVGEWEISWRVDGWRQSDLGQLWRPAYFHERGIAIHGYPEVPAHPASHGCVRVSMTAMDMLWAEGHVPEGTRVVVS